MLEISDLEFIMSRLGVERTVFLPRSGDLCANMDCYLVARGCYKKRRPTNRSIRRSAKQINEERDATHLDGSIFAATYAPMAEVTGYEDVFVKSESATCDATQLTRRTCARRRCVSRDEACVELRIKAAMDQPCQMEVHDMLHHPLGEVVFMQHDCIRTRSARVTHDKAVHGHHRYVLPYTCDVEGLCHLVNYYEVEASMNETAFSNIVDAISGVGLTFGLNIRICLLCEHVMYLRHCLKHSSFLEHVNLTWLVFGNVCVHNRDQVESGFVNVSYKFDAVKNSFNQEALCTLLLGPLFQGRQCTHYLSKRAPMTW